MDYVFANLAAIKNKIRRAIRPALLLDFDGTLSPIVPRPEGAILPEKTRQILKAINKRHPIAIITGRPLAVARQKVGVKRFLYGASHGLEWNFGGQAQQKPLPKKIRDKISRLRRALEAKALEYPSLIIEDKPFSLTFHYQLLPPPAKKAFVKWVKIFLKPVYQAPFLQVFYDRETVEIMPQVRWGKGEIGELALKFLRKKFGQIFLPVYIGDSTTDESAFRALKRGITVKVGRRGKSAARYYVRSQAEVYKFLAWLESLG